MGHSREGRVLGGTVTLADDMRTAIECLFGDAAGRTLGFTPRGLSPWAGLALALHDAQILPTSSAALWDGGSCIE